MNAKLKLSHRASSYRAAATALLGLGVMITVGAACYGLSNVTVGSLDTCGDGFVSGWNLTAGGELGDACLAAESSREAVTHGLLGAGIGGIAASALVFAFSVRAKDEEIEPPAGPDRGGEVSQA